MASTVEVTDQTFGRLRTYNWVMGALHAVQGLAVVALATDFTLPVTAAFPEGPPGTPAPAPEHSQTTSNERCSTTSPPSSTIVSKPRSVAIPSRTASRSNPATRTSPPAARAT